MNLKIIQRWDGFSAMIELQCHLLVIWR